MKKTYVEMIVEALRNIGGQGHYSVIYEEYRRVFVKYYGCDPEVRNKAWKASVRGVIERHSSDSKCYEGGRDLFVHIGDDMSGMWGLR